MVQCHKQVARTTVFVYLLLLNYNIFMVCSIAFTKIRAKTSSRVHNVSAFKMFILLLEKLIHDLCDTVQT